MTLLNSTTVSAAFAKAKMGEIQTICTNFTGVENEVARDAVSLLLEQEAAAEAAAAAAAASAAPAGTWENRTHAASEHVITYPSRLIYYLNEDSESTYHDLDTRSRNQVSESPVRAVHYMLYKH